MLAFRSAAPGPTILRTSFTNYRARLVGRRELLVGAAVQRAGALAVWRELGFEAVALRLVTEDGRPISSTRIRLLLHEGRLEDVRAILGRPPSAAGRVVPGDRRGRTLGVPTANVDVEAGTLFPGKGVYVARVRVAGRWFRAAVNIGHNPTFHDRDEPTTHVTVEAHLLGFEGDIYARDIRVDFLHKLRDERRFESVDALVAQMRADVSAAAALDDPALDEVGLGGA